MQENTKKDRRKTESVVYDSIKGGKHNVNEDKVVVVYVDLYIMMCVFDGVGSAKNNSLATQAASDFIYANHHLYYEDEDYRLGDMVYDLNEVILNLNYKSALTTCAICVYLNNNRLLASTLGDTRIYAVGKHYVNQLSEDHVLYKGANVITKCLGVSIAKHEIAEIHLENFKDDILICSDGFYNLFEENRLSFFEIFIMKHNNHMKNRMKDQIVNRNSDDATYIIYKNV